MERGSWGRLGTAGLVLWSVLAVGCTSAGGNDAATAGTDGAAGTPSALPGVEEFGFTEEEFADHVERTEAGIAACMTDAGFEYVPVDVGTIRAAQDRVRQDPGVSREEFKQQWGLAVTTRFDDPVRDTGMGEANLRIRDGLGEADRVAYDRTLWGDDSHQTFAFTLDEEDFSGTGGCTREAVAAVFEATMVDGTFENPKDVLVAEDPRIIAAEEAWADCMEAGGYDYLDQDEIIDEYEERLEELLDGDDPESLTGERATELGALQAEEIAVSLVDLRCQIDHTDAVYREVELEVFGQPVSG